MGTTSIFLMTMLSSFIILNKPDIYLYLITIRFGYSQWIAYTKQSGSSPHFTFPQIKNMFVAYHQCNMFLFSFGKRSIADSQVANGQEFMILVRSWLAMGILSQMQWWKLRPYTEQSRLPYSQGLIIKCWCVCFRLLHNQRARSNNTHLHDGNNCCQRRVLVWTHQKVIEYTQL